MNDGFDSVPDRPTASLDSLEMEFRRLISMAARIVSDAMKGGGVACKACGNTPFTDTDAALKGLSRIESILEKVGKMRGADPGRGGGDDEHRGDGRVGATAFKVTSRFGEAPARPCRRPGGDGDGRAAGGLPTAFA